ncbi:lysozyme-like [Cimex lectularius]|uniref:lysozyme n=1 Tax=Cimex lectularius TaxID=79782 RepID=A0A8I6RLD0_CIMLE|nr:lysozyme-like [Cimex lectularius]
MKFIISVVIVVAAFAVISDARVFTRCELAEELLNQGFKKSDLADWVCLVEHESSRNTTKKGGPNKNGSYDYGLFQINDKYWCSHDKKGKDCKAKCDDLRKDDITEASKCAQKIFKIHGFKAWYGWKNGCTKSKPDLTPCHL